MGRTVRDYRIETRTARSKLLRQKEPYWRLIAEGEHLGYYKGPRGGSWVARFRPDGAAYQKATLGRSDDIDDADGHHILDFGQAQEKARAWFREMRDAPSRSNLDPATTSPYTVRQAMTDYLEQYRRRGGKAVKDAEVRANALILPALGDLDVKALTAADVRNWHHKVAETPARLRISRKTTTLRFRPSDDNPDMERRRRATANRTLTILKAALNFAFQEGKVPMDEAWRRAKPFREADAPRIRYLSLPECQKLLAACPPDLGNIVNAALQTGCRYGELVSMRCGDLDVVSGTVRVRASKAGKGRNVVLSDEGAELFRRLIGERAPTELIFHKLDGTPWGASHQHRPIVAACNKAGISPPANFHILRHTYASHLAMARVPMAVIAANLGHSDTRMTERHYAHLAPSYVAETIRSAMRTYTLS